MRSLSTCALLIWVVVAGADSTWAATRHSPPQATPPAKEQPAVSAEQAALRRLIEQPDSALPEADRTEQARLRGMYVKRAFAPLWTQDRKVTLQAEGLIQALRTAEDRGLRSSDYDADAVMGLLDSSAPAAERIAAFDVRLSQTAARFLTHLHQGRVDPKAASFELHMSRPPLDYGALLTLLATTDTGVDAVISSVEPAFNHYQLLKSALKHYRELAAQPELTDLPGIKGTVKLGQPYAGAPALRRLLHALGDLSTLAEPKAAVEPKQAPKGGHKAKEGTKVAATKAQPKGTTKVALLDASLVKALKRYQVRHGLSPGGALDAATYAALTTPLAQRVRQIELTLERWRWLPSFETPPIIVNIPQFRLFALRSTQDLKQDILQMDVIVGQAFPEKQTPVFAADMRYVIFRPFWEIPHDIILNEELPKIRKDPRYLARQHLQIVQGDSDDNLTPLPATPENLDALESGKLRLRQEPGPDNSLGLIKFMFPNSHDVYLHSTPAHSLFKETRRDFSHGCIRVSDPAALAVHVLRDTPGDWTLEKVQEAMKSGDNQRVNLAHPIRVYILYASALATEDGTVLFLNDIYGHDRELETLLQLPPVAPPAAAAAQVTTRPRS